MHSWLFCHWSDCTNVRFSNPLSFLLRLWRTYGFRPPRTNDWTSERFRAVVLRVANARVGPGSTQYGGQDRSPNQSGEHRGQQNPSNRTEHAVRQPHQTNTPRSADKAVEPQIGGFDCPDPDGVWLATSYSARCDFDVEDVGCSCGTDDDQQGVGLPHFGSVGVQPCGRIRSI